MIKIKYKKEDLIEKKFADRTFYYIKGKEEYGYYRAVDKDGFESYWHIDEGVQERHREDGPALTLSNGKQEWYYFGKHLNCKTQEEFEELMKLKAFW